MATTLSGWERLYGTGRSGDLSVWHEKITRGTSETDTYGSAITFLPPGVNFLVGMAPGAALSTGTDLAIFASPVIGGTHSLLKDDLISITTGTGYAFGQYVVATNGEMPSYKCFLDGDATNKENFDIYIAFVTP